MLGKLSVLKGCFFYKLGTNLVKAYTQKKNWLFFLGRIFFTYSHFGPNFRCSVHLDLPIPALHMSGVVIEVTFYFYSLFLQLCTRVASQAKRASRVDTKQE